MKVAGFERSTLTLAAILRGGRASGKAGSTPAQHSLLHSVQSRVTTGAALLSGLEPGVLGEEEWAARKPAADSGKKEEEALLAAEDFEAAALAFIAQRVTANSGVISLRNEFLMQLTERCVQGGAGSISGTSGTGSKGKKTKKESKESKEPAVLSSVLRALLRHSVDIAMNPHVLPRLMTANDITTLLLYLMQAPAVPESNLLTLTVYFLGVEDDVAKQFATEYGWETARGNEVMRLLLLAGRFLLRVNAKSSALRQSMRELSTDMAYQVALLLTVRVRDGFDA